MFAHHTPHNKEKYTCSCVQLRRGVAAQLGKESGARTKWSAPLLFTVNAAGAGATLGVTEIASVLVLDTPEACCAFLRTQVCAPPGLQHLQWHLQMQHCHIAQLSLQYIC